LHNLNN
jgi:hypothetical protein